MKRQRKYGTPRRSPRASTCDGNALALIMHRLQELGVAAGSVTTLHPWLKDQALLDQPVGEGLDASNYATDAGGWLR
jgi:glyceraldehyde-3-phosphate dehydrogenase/erythrose-4-phosphate dehydrogenase